MPAPKPDRFFIGSVIIIFTLSIVAYLILFSALATGKRTTPHQAKAQTPIVENISPGEKIVTSICIKCHRFGLMRAPKLGNKRDWAPRIKKGKTTLYSHALNGFNKMPARGGKKRLTDTQVKLAVDYMVSLVE